MTGLPTYYQASPTIYKQHGYHLYDFLSSVRDTKVRGSLGERVIDTIYTITA